MSAFDVVRDFERAVADYAGSKFAVAVNSCTSALFLCMKYAAKGTVTLPALTFISVPQQALHAGLDVEFEDYAWTGVYQLKPFDIWDGALRFKRGMYRGGLHCLSFHARKLLNIGEGGMVLTDDERAAEWLRRAAYSGRGAPGYRIEDITMLGWQFYMHPERAARGLHLMEYVADDLPDQAMVYPDLRECPVFQKPQLRVAYG